MYARRVIMQSLKSIRLTEVDKFFKQSLEQKKTDSTVEFNSRNKAFRNVKIRYFKETGFP